MRYCQGRDEAGQAYALSDPMAAQLQALASAHAGDADASVAALCGLRGIWGVAVLVLGLATGFLSLLGTAGAALTLGAVLVWAVRLPPLAAQPPRAG